MKIQAILAKYRQVEQAILYGSRAKNTFKPGSDIDLTLKGEDLDLHVLNKISHDLYEFPIPYRIDVSIYDRIDNPDLRDHIDRVGRILYKRQERESDSVQSSSAKTS